MRFKKKDLWVRFYRRRWMQKRGFVGIIQEKRFVGKIQEEKMDAKKRSERKLRNISPGSW